MWHGRQEKAWKCDRYRISRGHWKATKRKDSVKKTKFLYTMRTVMQNFTMLSLFLYAQYYHMLPYCSEMAQLRQSCTQFKNWALQKPGGFLSHGRFNIGNPHCLSGELAEHGRIVWHAVTGWHTGVGDTGDTRRQSKNAKLFVGRAQVALGCMGRWGSGGSINFYELCSLNWNWPNENEVKNK